MADQTRGRKDKKKKRRIFPYIMLVIIFLFGSSGAYAGYLLNQAANAAEKANAPLSRGEKSDMREEAVQPLKDNVSLLIMGVDESEVRKSTYGEATRTDALLYATFNMKEKSVKLLSIPRDSYVTLPEMKRKDKINHAHAYNGVEGTINAVESLLEAPVDYYVKVNFESFLDIVDLLGGIEVDVPVSFTEQDSSDTRNAIKITKGLQTLNGEQALALARTRKIDSDLERGQRQMLVVEAIVKKAISANTLFKIDGLLGILSDNVKTNMTLSDITAFYKYAASLGSLQIDKLQLEGTDGNIDGSYYFILDEKKLGLLQDELRSHLEWKEKKSTRTTTTEADSPKEKKEQSKAKQQPTTPKVVQEKQKPTTSTEKKQPPKETQPSKEKQQPAQETTTKPSDKQDSTKEKPPTPPDKKEPTETNKPTDKKEPAESTNKQNPTTNSANN